MKIRTDIDASRYVSTAPFAGGFETMTFVNGDEVACKRSKTSRSARTAHRRAVSKARAASEGIAEFWAESATTSVLASYKHARIVEV